VRRRRRYLRSALPGAIYRVWPSTRKVPAMEAAIPTAAMRMGRTAQPYAKFVACSNIGTKYDTANYGPDIGFKEVCTHARHIADVVADIVGYDGRVAWIILRDTGFNLAYQIGSYIGRLGEDATAYPGKEGYGGGSEAETGHDGKDGVMQGRQAAAEKSGCPQP
jgi:hypothetical protein